MDLAEALPIVVEYNKHCLGLAPYEVGQDGQPDLPYNGRQVHEALDIVITHCKATGNFMS